MNRGTFQPGVFPTKEVPKNKSLSTGHAVKMCLVGAILGFEWTDIGAHLKRRTSILSVVGKIMFISHKRREWGDVCKTLFHNTAVAASKHS